MAYLLDSNVFMEAKDRYYGLDVCPGFWEWLLVEHQRGSLISIEPVFDEIMAGDEALHEWARKAKDAGFFLKLSPQDLTKTGSVLQWVEAQDYERGAKDAFARGADPFLIGCAIARRAVLVSHEKTAHDSKKKVRIPDVCKGMNVPCEQPFQYLRQLGARFDLRKDATESVVPAAGGDELPAFLRVN